MRLLGIRDLKMIERNKALAKASIEKDGKVFKADLVYYLQANYCISIRAGRHDKALDTKELEEYIFANRSDLKNDINSKVERIKQEARSDFHNILK